MNKTPSTKIELNANKLARAQSLDDLARILFPGNKLHQRVFLAIWVELKYAQGQFLASLALLCDKYGFTARTLESVRSKMRRLGLIDHVSRFNQAHGYREGWVFSSRFSRALTELSQLAANVRGKGTEYQEQKDRDTFRYL